MIWKILALIALVTLPFSVVFWQKSHGSPQQYRYDVTPYKSLRVKLKEGVCGFRLLSMPAKVGGRSEFRGSLSFDAGPGGRTLLFSSVKTGPYRVTWFVFPFWLSTGLLMILAAVPVAQGPIKRSWRKWHGWCVACGYDLRGTRSPRCSECGTRFR